VRGRVFDPIGKNVGKGRGGALSVKKDRGELGVERKVRENWVCKTVLGKRYIPLQGEAKRFRRSREGGGGKDYGEDGLKKNVYAEGGRTSDGQR